MKRTLPGIQVAGAVAVVTGGGSGIGRATAQRFAADNARAVVVADVNASSAKAATKHGAVAIAELLAITQGIELLGVLAATRERSPMRHDCQALPTAPGGRCST